MQAGVIAACFTANDTEDMAFAASVITPVRNIGIKDSAFAAAGHGCAYEVHSHGGKEYEGHHGKYQSIGEQPEDRDRAEIVYG